MKKNSRYIVVLMFAVLNILTLRAEDSKMQSEKNANQTNKATREDDNLRAYDTFLDGPSDTHPSFNNIDCETCITFADISEMDLYLGDIYPGITRYFTDDNYVLFEIHSCASRIRIYKVNDVHFPYLYTGNNDNVTSVWYRGLTSACTTSFNNNSVPVDIPNSNLRGPYYARYYLYYVMVKITAITAPVKAKMGLHYAAPSIRVERR